MVSALQRSSLGLSCPQPSLADLFWPSFLCSRKCAQLFILCLVSHCIRVCTVAYFVPVGLFLLGLLLSHFVHVRDLQPALPHCEMTRTDSSTPTGAVSLIVALTAPRTERDWKTCAAPGLSRLTLHTSCRWYCGNCNNSDVPETSPEKSFFCSLHNWDFW